jgi:DNA polymerase-1
MKLSQTAGISLAEAEAFIKEYFRNFPSLAEWIRSQHRFAKMNGYVKSMFGRIRYLPDAQLDTRDFGNKIKMEAALKRAVNTPVQADASDLTLYSLGRIWEYLNKYEHTDPKWPSRLRGSVHDSILMSVHVNDLPDIVSHIKAEILENPQLDFIVSKGVNLRADCSIGPNWGEQKDLEFGE